MRDTISFLEASNKLFENGFLSHRKITSLDSTVVDNILSGLLFFTDWYVKLEESGNFQPINPREKRFLGWQTFDLLRLSVYGFTDFVNKFLGLYPMHYIIPFRINGSAVESYFAQIRQRAGAGPLTSVNLPYASARLAASNATDAKSRKRKVDDSFRNESLYLKRSKRL